MITRKDLTLILVTALTTAGIVVVAQPSATRMLGPTVVDWNSIQPKTTTTGSSRKFFDAPTATLQRLECHVTTLNPGQASHPPHHHPEEELVIIKEGTVETLSDGVWKRVGPGSVILNACNSTHALRNVGDTPATYHVIMWRSPMTPAKETASANQMEAATNSPAK